MGWGPGSPALAGRLPARGVHWPASMEGMRRQRGMFSQPSSKSSAGPTTSCRGVQQSGSKVADRRAGAQQQGGRARARLERPMPQLASAQRVPPPPLVVCGSSRQVSGLPEDTRACRPHHGAAPPPSPRPAKPPSQAHRARHLRRSAWRPGGAQGSGCALPLPAAAAGAPRRPPWRAQSATSAARGGRWCTQCRRRRAPAAPVHQAQLNSTGPFCVWRLARHMRSMRGSRL